MRPHLLVVASLAFVVVLAGCTTPSGEASPEPALDNSTATVSEYETYVFDHGDTGTPAIRGGIAYSHEVDDEQYFATLVTSHDGTARFNTSVLDADARAFVNTTNFEAASLIVVQTFPASSSPDYRVEQLSRENDTVHLRINDSSRGGTGDISVETVLVRIPLDRSDTLREATVTTEEGFTFNTSTGVVTRAGPSGEDTESDTIELPYAADNESQNVDDPRGIHIRNDANTTNGYTITVTETETPACREATPPCGRPSEEITIFQQTDKTRANTESSIDNVIAKRGTYTLTVTTEVAAENGSRTTLTETFEWQIDGSAGDVVITMTNDDIEHRQATDDSTHQTEDDN